MIVKVSQLKGKKILSGEGKRVEDVDDILFDPQQKTVVALVAKKSGMFTGAKILMISDIHQIGHDAVLVGKEDTIRKASEVNSYIEKLAKDSAMNLSKNKLVGEDHTEYGTVSDVFFESTSGKVIGFEYTKGTMSQHKKTMKVLDILSVGQDAIVVRPIMVNAAGQVKQSTHQRNQQVRRYPQTPHRPHPAQQIKFTTKPPVNKSLTQDISSEERKRIEDTIGKYATKNILLPTDEVLIKQNDIVTHESLRVAYTYGVLEQVLRNSSLTPVIP